MKKIFAIAALLASGAVISQTNAQYYNMVNQVSNMVQNAVIGGFNYKGLVEAEYVQGIGNTDVNFLNFTTTQGFSYASWFYMGAGAGIDIAFSNISDPYTGDRYGTSTTKTGVMVPLFTDFRFMIGSQNAVALNIGVKLGGIFLMGSSYLELNNGYLSSKEYFYLRPSVGVRFPLSADKPKQAINIGVAYQLITANNFYYWGGPASSNATLNGLGVNISYEW